MSAAAQIYTTDEDLVAEAERAFAEDPSYIVEMVESAARAIRKAAIWAARREASEAEKGSRRQCTAAFPAGTTCKNSSPCGFGSCLFATGPLASIHPAGDKGKLKTRPVPSEHPEYGMDDAIERLTAIHVKEATRRL